MDGREAFAKRYREGLAKACLKERSLGGWAVCDCLLSRLASRGVTLNNAFGYPEMVWLRFEASLRMGILDPLPLLQI
jgi:hypothetical protein